MNWYKKSQIEEELDFDWDIENAQTIEQAVQVFNKYKISYKVINFDNADPVIRFADKIWSDGWIKNAMKWIYDIPDLYLDDYVKMPEENFWEGVSEGQEVYHATNEDNVESILKNGLRAECVTRGISNRGMACAVFASYNEDAIESYGDAVFAINIGKMAQDGFTPDVSGEDPIQEATQRQAIAYRLGIFDADFSDSYSSDGLDEDTIAIFSNIPAKYLRRIR